MNKEAFVYLWVDKKNKKFYVGYHKGTPDDGYVCSSREMKEEHRVRPDDFERIILATGSTKEMLAYEAEVLRKHDAARNPLFYNLCNGGKDWHEAAWEPEVAERRRITSEKSKPKRIEKLRKTNMERLGVETPFHSPEIQATIQSSAQEKFGKRSFAACPEVREKIKKTNLEKYGTTSPTANNVILDRMLENNVKKWGYKATSQHPDVKEKARQTNLERYGVEWNGASEELIRKRTETNLKKWGYTSTASHPEVRAKQMATRRKKRDAILALPDDDFFKLVVETYVLEVGARGNVLRQDNVCKLLKERGTDKDYAYDRISKLYHERNTK